MIPPPPLSLGDAIRPGPYRLHSRHRRSTLWVHPSPADPTDAPLLCLVDPTIGPGPLNWVLPNPHDFAPPGDAFTLDSLPPAAPRYDSLAPALPPSALADLVAFLRAALPSAAAPDSLVPLFVCFPTLADASVPPLLRTLRRYLRPLLPRLRSPDPATVRDAVSAIRGAGPGATPSGDDFLAGFFLAHFIQTRTLVSPDLLSAALGQNPLSNAFIRLAAAGRVHAPFRDLLQTPTPATLRRALDFGHTSGSDTLAGLAYGLGVWTHPAATTR